MSQHSCLHKTWLTGASSGTYRFVLKASITFCHCRKRGVSRNYLFWDWIDCVLDVLGHFFPWRVRREEKPRVPVPDPTQVWWRLRVRGLGAWICPWDTRTGIIVPQPVPILSVSLARTTGARSGNIHRESGTASWHLNRDPKSCFI